MMSISLESLAKHRVCSNHLFLSQMYPASSLTSANYAKWLMSDSDLPAMTFTSGASV